MIVNELFISLKIVGNRKIQVITKAKYCIRDANIRKYSRQPLINTGCEMLWFVCLFRCFFVFFHFWKWAKYNIGF